MSETNFIMNKKDADILAAYNNGAKEGQRIAQAEIAQLKTALTSANKKIERLKEYAWHKKSCVAYFTQKYDCDCGYEQAL
jgi:hypothetical protein